MVNADEGDKTGKKATNVCPHCGRYIGPVESCPYCKKKVEKRTELKTLKYGSVVFAIVGLLLLWQYSLAVGYPSPDISDIRETMNYANIEIGGRVVQGSTYYHSEATGDGTIYFTIDDGTGQIRVVAYSSEAKDMIEQQRLPAYGDIVNFVGTVNYRGSDVRIILSSANSLDIERPEGTSYTATELNQLEEDDIEEGSRATVTGEVKTSVKDQGFSYVFDIGDDDETVRVLIYNTTIRLTGGEMADGSSLGTLEVGDNVTISGSLRWRYGWELIPAEASEIHVNRRRSADES